MGKADVQELIVGALEHIEERERFSSVGPPFALHRLADEPELHERDKQRGHQEGNHQHDGDAPREHDNKVLEHPRERYQEREERHRDGHSGRED